MLNKFSKVGFATASFLLPVFAMAGEPLGGTSAFFGNARDLVSDILIPLAFSLALLAFFYGVAKYIWSEGSGKAEGKQIMIWGVVGLFVMSCIWGIVFFVGEEIGVDVYENSSLIPTIETE